MGKKKNFSVKRFCIEQMQKSDKEMATFIDVARVKLGYAKQYNNAVKNDIDMARLEHQWAETARKSIDSLNK